MGTRRQGGHDEQLGRAIGPRRGKPGLEFRRSIALAQNALAAAEREPGIFPAGRGQAEIRSLCPSGLVVRHNARPSTNRTATILRSALESYNFA